MKLTFTDHVIDPIAEGIDLVIRFGDLTNSDGMIARKLSTQTLMTCAAPTYLKARGEPETVEDLMNHSCIVGYRRGRPLSWQLMVNGEKYRFQPPPTYELGDGDAILQSAVAGFGICQLPSSIVGPHIESGALVQLLAEQSNCRVDVHALWPETSHLSPKIRHVVDRLVEVAAAGRLG